MSEHEWVDVPELSEQYVYTLDMPLEQHNTEMFNAGREAVESKLVATQRKLMTTESQLRELADVGIQSAQRTNAELERVTEKVAEQEQMIADLQAIIAENRGLNEKLDAQRREAVNSLRAAAASERNAWKDLEAKSAECQQLLAAKASADKGWDAFEAKKSEWHKLYEEKERISHACNELREQLRCARRDHEATKSHHTSLIEDRAHVGKELVKVRGELEVEKEAVGVFQAQLAQAEKQLASLPKQPQTIANELDRLRKELQAETERKESLQRCVASRNEQIDRLKREHEATKAHQLAMIAEDQKRLVHELTTAREELQGVREKLATRGRELTAQIHVSQLMAREKELFRKEAGEMRTRMESAEQQLRDTDNREGVVEEEFRRLESEQKRELAESHLQNKTMKAEMEKVFTERDILLEHSASLEVQIRTLIEEQAIREFHIQHGSPATTAAQLAPSHSQQPPPTSPTTTGMSAETKAALVAFSETGQIIEHGSDEANGPYSSRTNGAGGAGASLIDNIAVDEQEILFLKDRLGHTERELDRTLSELATSRREVESMRIEGHGRDREDMMRIACLNLDTRVPVFFGRVIHLDKVQGETIFHGHMRVRALVSQVASEFGLASQTLYTIRVCGVDVATLNSDEPIGFAMPHALFANINNLSILVTPTGPEEEYM